MSDAGEALHPLDAMTVSTDNHDVLLENARVRVLDTRLAPGERTPVHTHQWPAALYVLSWSDFVRYDPDGNVLVDSRAAGVTADRDLAHTVRRSDRGAGR